MKNIFELEIWKDNLKRLISKREILDSIISESSLINLSTREFRNKIVGKYFSKIERFGPFIILSVNDDDFFIFKISPESTLNIKREILDTNTKLIIKYDQFTFQLKDHASRTIIEYAKADISTSNLVGSIGLDIKHLDFKRFAEICKEYKKPIKAILTDDRIIAGLSSLDTDEILFMAKIRPDRSSEDLEFTEVSNIYRAIYEYLSFSINHARKQMGRFFVTPNMDWINVSGKEGQICSVSGDTIKQKNVEGFDTYYCPGCQE